MVYAAPTFEPGDDCCPYCEDPLCPAKEEVDCPEYEDYDDDFSRGYGF